jgi:hypothetical protein
MKKGISKLAKTRSFYDLLKAPRHELSHKEITELLIRADETHVDRLANSLGEYLRKSLPEAIAK